MSKIKDNTPIIIGVGQITEAVPDDISTASSHADLAGKAAVVALQDAHTQELAKAIDVLVGGHIPNNYPGRTMEYMRETKKVDFGAYLISE